MLQFVEFQLLLVSPIIAIWGIVLWRERPTWLGWTLWLGLVASFAAIAFLHSRMDQRLEFDSHAVTGHGFYSLHRVYLTISTGQWLLSLALLGLPMHRWKQEDRRDGDATNCAHL